jgi:hypothetical protein
MLGVRISMRDLARLHCGFILLVILVLGIQRCEGCSVEQDKQSRWGFRGKTFWNWLELLVVPVALAAIGFVFTMQQDQPARYTH